MPARSNGFQRLMKTVYEQLADAQTTVTESAVIPESASAAGREVDILVERTMSGHRVRMAIECRDTSRRQSVEWIDQLHGKYLDTDIKVVAVSKCGFTRSATKKAAAKGIELLTLDAALENAWSARFERLALCITGHSDVIDLDRLRFDITPPRKEPFGPVDIVEAEDGEKIGTLQEFLEMIGDALSSGKLDELYRPHMKDHFRVLADFGKQTTAYLEWRPNETFFIRPSTEIRHRINRVLLPVVSQWRYSKLPMSRMTYGESVLVSQATVTGTPSMQFTVVQTVDKAEAKVLIEPIRTKSRRGAK